MAKLRGLLRGLTYYSRVTVPKALVTRFGRSQIWKSLGTADRAEAEALHLNEAARWKAAFVEVARAGDADASMDSAETPLTNADAADLARRFFRRAKAQLDTSALSPAELDDDDRESIETDLQLQLSVLASWRNPDAHLMVEQAGTEALEGAGIAWPSSSDGGQHLSEFLRRALIQLHTIELARLHGDHSDRITDSLFDPASVSHSPMAAWSAPSARQSVAALGECIDRYIAEELALRPVTDKTILKHKSLLKHIGDFFNRTTPMCNITRADCNRFRDTLAKLPPNFSRKGKRVQSLERIAERNGAGLTLAWMTQNDYLKMMSDLMGWAVKERLVLDNVAADMVPRKKREAAETQRLPFKADELQAIFKAPVYTGCVDDEQGFAKPGPNIIRRSRYWLPLLALFTGMRMGEILQLTPDHVSRSVNGTIFIVLTRDMTLKTDNAAREIPIHPMLERLGFAVWVEEMQRKGVNELFGDVPASKHGYRSDTFTKRFATFLKKIELPAERKRKLSFHSFRHTFKDALNETEASEEIKDEICGWARSKVTGRRYGTGLSADRLKPFIDQVEFNIDLSSLEAASGSETGRT